MYYKKEHTERAQEFAKSWYSRACSGCDEATLADLLTPLLQRVADQAVAAERQRAINVFTSLLDPTR